MYERQLLRELESLRPDVASSNAKVAPKTNGIPKPMIIPPLEDDSKSSLGPSLNRGPVPASSIPPSVISGRPSISQAPVPPQSPNAGPSKPPVTALQPPRPPPVSSDTAPAEAGVARPPLGGRFADGTKSMFIQPSSSPSFPSSAHAQSSGPPTAVPQSPNTDPLLGSSLMSSDPIQRPGTTDGTSRSAGDVDPLGGIRPAYMSASVRVQPTRRRLDAREAASKLANMF